MSKYVSQSVAESQQGRPLPFHLIFRHKLVHPEIGGFPFNISATAEASDFKFGTQLEFAKAHHKITPRRKGARGSGLGEHPKIWGFAFSIYTVGNGWSYPLQIWYTAWVYPAASWNHTQRKKWAWPWARGAPKNFEVPLQYLHNGWS